VLQFVDLGTKRPLRVTVSEAEESAAKEPPMKKEVDNFSAEPLPLPTAILDARADPSAEDKEPGKTFVLRTEKYAAPIILYRAGGRAQSRGATAGP